MNWNRDLEPFENKVIAVDFDGTVVSDKFPLIGEPHMELVSWIKECKFKGCKLILWTCRTDVTIVDGTGALENAVNFCREELDLEFEAVNQNLPEVQEKWENDTRKVLADYYLDDKCLSYE